MFFEGFSFETQTIMSVYTQNTQIFKSDTTGSCTPEDNRLRPGFFLLHQKDKGGRSEAVFESSVQDLIMQDKFSCFLQEKFSFVI